MAYYCVSAPGVEDVTEGSVDCHEMDWELCPCPCAEEGSLPGEGCGAAGEEDLRQTDDEAYEIVTE